MKLSDIAQSYGSAHRRLDLDLFPFPPGRWHLVATRRTRSPGMYVLTSIHGTLKWWKTEDLSTPWTGIVLDSMSEYTIESCTVDNPNACPMCARDVRDFHIPSWFPPEAPPYFETAFADGWKALPEGTTTTSEDLCWYTKVLHVPPFLPKDFWTTGTPRVVGSYVGDPAWRLPVFRRRTR